MEPPVSAAQSDTQVAITENVQYSKDKVLGTGSFGNVYKGVLDGRKIAVKRILITAFKEIEKEMQTLSHPNILQYLKITANHDFV